MEAYEDNGVSTFTLGRVRVDHVKGLKWGKETSTMGEARSGQGRDQKGKKVLIEN